MIPLSNDPCYDDLYNSKWEVHTKKKRKQPWIIAMDGNAGPNILHDLEIFVSYGERAFRKTSLPMAILFKAVSHYWPHMDWSER